MRETRRLARLGQLIRARRNTSAAHELPPSRDRFIGRVLVAVLLCGALELANFVTVAAIAQRAPVTQESNPTVSSITPTGGCVQYILGGTPVIRCPGG